MVQLSLKRDIRGNSLTLILIVMSISCIQNPWRFRSHKIQEIFSPTFPSVTISSKGFIIVPKGCNGTDRNHSVWFKGKHHPKAVEMEVSP